MEKRAGSKTQDMAYIALFAVVMAVCAWIVIPMVVPFTLQTFAVFLAVGVLGGKRATFAILLYLLLGIIGIPVFSGFTGGIGVLLGNTGGYLVGFLCTSLIMWGMERLFGKKHGYFGCPWWDLIKMALAMLVRKRLIKAIKVN